MENFICFPIARSLTMRVNSNTTGKRIWIRVEKKEEIKEAEIA